MSKEEQNAFLMMAEVTHNTLEIYRTMVAAMEADPNMAKRSGEPWFMHLKATVSILTATEKLLKKEGASG